MKNTDIGQHLQITILPWYSFQLFADYKSVMVGTCLLGEMQFGLWSATKLSSIQIFIAHIIRKTPQDILNKIGGLFTKQAHESSKDAVDGSQAPRWISFCPINSSPAERWGPDTFWNTLFSLFDWKYNFRNFDFGKYTWKIFWKSSFVKHTLRNDKVHLWKAPNFTKP